MANTQNQEQQTQYHIRLQGHLNNEWGDWFGGVTITLLDDGTTLLICQIVDQSALHSLLRQIRDMGLHLISVNSVHNSQFSNAQIAVNHIESRGDVLMKAIICTKYGSADHLELQDVPKPTPKNNEVLIRMHATSVTASDVLMRALKANLMFKIIIQAAMGFGKPRNPILGMVGAGVVESVGKDVTAFKPGDEVFAYGSMSMSKIRWGFYGEYMCLPEDWNIALKPENLTFEEATAIPYGTLLAMHVMEKAIIQPGQKVLIYGASGSIGTMAIQLAKHAGAEVTAVCSNRNFDMVTSLGADKVIDYTRDDAITQLEQYDWVLDTVGDNKTSPLKDASKTALTANGQYLSVDKGMPTTSHDKFLRVKELAEQGVLKPIIDRRYSLEEMVEAHKYVETGHKRGNVIVTIGT